MIDSILSIIAGIAPSFASALARLIGREPLPPPEAPVKPGFDGIRAREDEALAKKTAANGKASPGPS